MVCDLVVFMNSEFGIYIHNWYNEVGVFHSNTIETVLFHKHDGSGSQNAMSSRRLLVTKTAVLSSALTTDHLIATNGAAPTKSLMPV